MEEENIVPYLLRVDVVNTIRGLGGKEKELVIVKKLLKSLHSKFDSSMKVKRLYSDFSEDLDPE